MNIWIGRLTRRRNCEYRLKIFFFLFDENVKLIRYDYWRWSENIKKQFAHTERPLNPLHCLQRIFFFLNYVHSYYSSVSCNTRIFFIIIIIERKQSKRGYRRNGLRIFECSATYHDTLCTLERYRGRVSFILQ